MTVLIPSLLPPPMPFKIFVILAGVAGIDAAEAIDDAGAGEHGFAKHGLAAGGVADDGEVPNVGGSVGLIHGMAFSVTLMLWWLITQV